MYGIKLYDYVPRPEPAESGRIVAAHYYPSWTKGKNGLIKEFDDMHDFPDRTPLMGYYEDKNPEVIDWEIKWALEHGINCWIYCWYRKKENEGKPVTVDSLRLGQGLHEGFFNARYAPMMKFAIMYEASKRWGGTDREDMLTNLLPFWFDNYFEKENYLVIDNKPVLFVYDNGRQLWESMSAEEHKSLLDECRAYAKKRGFDGMYIALQDPWWTYENRVTEARSRGYDWTFNYGAKVDGRIDVSSADALKSQLEFNKELMQAVPYEFNPTVGAFRDHEPRLYTLPYGGGFPSPTAWRYADALYYLNFEDYRTLLREVKALSDAAPADSIAHRLIMIDNWNEWDEGHYILPSYRFGFKHLQAIREELTERNNLPDYRTPEALGFGPYDEVWGGRDLDLSQDNDHKKLDDLPFRFYRKDGTIRDAE